MGWAAARPRLLVGIAAVALALLVGWLLWPKADGTGSTRYDTPAKAVASTCHAVEIISTQRHETPARITVAWRADNTVIWAALVAEEIGGYRVEKCQYQKAPHG
jgi:hypothetical protein